MKIEDVLRNLYDGRQMAFYEKDKFLKAIKHFEEVSDWSTVNSADVDVRRVGVGIEGYEAAKDIVIPKNVNDTISLELIGQDLAEDAEEFRLSFSDKADVSRRYLPSLRGTASFVERMGAYSLGFPNLSDDDKIEQIKVNGAAYNKPILLRFQGGKMQAAHSENYTVLSQVDLLDELLYYLDNNGYRYEFHHGNITNELTEATFAVQGGFAGDFGMILGTNDIQTFLRFQTSDTGLSAATVSLQVKALYPDGRQEFMYMPDLARLEHKGNVDIDTFIGLLGGMEGKTEDYRTQLELMSVKNVKYPENALYNAMYLANVSTKARNTIMELIVDKKTLTQLDVYLYATRAINLMNDQKAADTSIARSIYQLGRIATKEFKWDRIDLSYQLK